MTLAWLRDANELFRKLGRAVIACSVDLACAPYIATAVAALNAEEGTTPPRYVDAGVFAAWLKAIPELSNLLVPIATAADFDEDRTIATLLFVLELVTRGETDESETYHQIASGQLTLESALRQRELARLTTQLTRAEQQLADAPPVHADPATTAALDGASHIRGDGIAIPVHPGASVLSGSLSESLSSDDGDVQAMLAVPATVDEIGELYRAWAHRHGWLIEAEEADDRHHELRFAHHEHRLFLLITRWIGPEPSAMIMLRLKSAGPVRFEVGNDAAVAESERAARIAAGPPSLPSVTRPWPAVMRPLRATPDSADALTVIFGCSPAPPLPDSWSPDHVVADRGLLYVAEDDFVWCIDPISGQVERLAGLRNGGPFRRIGGLAFDGRDALVITDRSSRQVYTLELSTNRLDVLASTLKNPTAVACVGDAVYVACDTTELYAIDRTTGAVAPFASEFRNIGALVAHGDHALYVADDEMLRRVDLTTATVTTILTLPRGRLTGLASDGTQLYATTHSTIERITPSGTRETVVGTEDNPHHDPDGLAVDANVSDSVAPAWDGAGLVFATRRRLRRFDVARRDVVTLPVPPTSNAALLGTIIGIGSLGGTRIALAFRKPATIAVIDYATGAREDIALELATSAALRALATDGSDRVFVTDRDGNTWSVAVSSRAVTRIEAIAPTDKPTVLAFGEPDRLFVALEASGTIVAIDLASNRSRIVASGLQATRALAFDLARAALYASDSEILRIDLASGDITAVTDAKFAGHADGPRGVARFLGRDHIAVSPDGDVYVSEHNRIRRIRAADGHVTTPIGRRGSGLVLGDLPGGLESPTGLCFLPSGELAIVDRDQNVVLRARCTPLRRADR